jgi:hypothetical protein
MSYQEKYLKYKNKYLALKSKYGHLLNTTEEPSMPIANNSVNMSKNLFDLDESEQAPISIAPKIINLTGGAKNVEPETETDTTINNYTSSKVDTSSEAISSLFKQAGGKPTKKGKKSKRHFFQDKSDSDLSSSSTMSEAESDSEFSSSEIDW